MPKPQSELEYVSNNSFMTSRVKVPNAFGGDYEDPLEALKAAHKKEENEKRLIEPTTPTTPTTPSPSLGDLFSDDSSKEVQSTPTIPSPTTPTTPSKKLEPTAPNKDFQKVSNSITRQAIPSGVFGSGKAKQLYDALYSLTRGAIRPMRIVRITKPKLMKLAGIGTRQTLWLNLQHLESVGLVRKNVVLGEHGGNEYEVFVPEELPDIDLQTIPTIPTTPTTPSSPTNWVYQVQNLEGVVGIESNPTAPSSQPVNTVSSDAPKTSFKDNTKNDDDNARVSEAFSILQKRLDVATKKITGKGVSKSEAEKWGTLADLLILELEVAASRADGVSSVPAFLTEILRRQFFAARQQQSSGKPVKTKTDTVCKPESGSYEIKPLDENGREAALEQLREWAGDDLLQDFKKWYTPEDWTWLIEKLEIQK